MRIRIDYELLDSGEGAKLERFGNTILNRPSSLCLWKRRLSPNIWDGADAKYDPKLGWISKESHKKQWTVNTDYSIAVILRLQDNGQIGIFPEHDLYLDLVSEAIDSLHVRLNRPTKVLNLFAYTGLASLRSLKQGAEVTHVDLAKTAINWAKENIAVNDLLSSKVRLITDDALAFCEREIRRNNHYDVIIVDPPNFSRISKNKSWAMEEILPALIDSLFKLLDKAGTIFLTTHGLFGSAELCANLCYDHSDNSSLAIRKETLTLKESKGLREIPAGSLTIINRRV